MKRESYRYYRQLVFFASIGFHFGLSIAIGLFMGLWLDGKFNSSPWFLLGGLFLGVCAGFRNLAIVIRRVRKY